MLETNNQLLGPVIADIAGQTLSDEDIALIKNPLIGGLILFTRNYSTPSQLDALVKQIRSVRADIILAVDHEGGRVQRFREGSEDENRVYTLIDLPVLTIFQGEQPWRVEAKKGKLLGDGQSIELWEDVVIRQKNESGTYTQLTTNKLLILPHEKVAQTEETVKINSQIGRAHV